MNSRDIEPHQADMIFRSLQPKLAYLLKLKDRMEKRGFPRDDPFLQKVRTAYDAMHTLYMECHTMSVQMGAGRRRNS